jgi:prenyltransferase/squalene oxidase-like repeat protein
MAPPLGGPPACFFDMSIEILISKQNSDGGWPYVRGGSWTEPTVYAVMAMLEAGEMRAARRGLQWIRAARRSDGGWPPRLEIDQSTWVTALVALLPEEHLQPGAHDGAIQWLLGTAGKESSKVYRLREWMLGNTAPADQEFPGWPWVPGTAAWVGPTSVAILALEKEDRRRQSPQVRRRVAEGRSFLVARMCQEGGWNHGSSHALGYESKPYPETTGLALTALRGSQAPEVQVALNVARRFLAECHSADALNWLRLGLYAHGQLPVGYCPPSEVAYRTVPETSLDVLVNSVEAGRTCFWE